MPVQFKVTQVTFKGQGQSARSQDGNNFSRFLHYTQLFLLLYVCIFQLYLYVYFYDDGSGLSTLSSIKLIERCRH